MSKLALFLSMIFLSLSVHAGLFTIERSGIPALDAVLTELEEGVNSSIPDAEQTTYLEGMANASVMSTKGSGVDYASDISILGFTYNILGIGIASGDSTFFDVISGDINETDLAGIGLQMSFTLGVNLRLLPIDNFLGFDLNKTKLYLQGFSADIPDTTSFKGDFNVYGIHLQYKWIEPASIGLVKWGGVDISTGIEYQQLHLELIVPFTNETEAGGGYTASFTGDVNVGADVSTYSIPFEISTYARVLYSLKPYMGLAGDLNFGSAESIVTSDQTISFSGTTSGTVAGSINLGESVAPTFFTMRWFAGVQADIWLFKMFAQFQQSLTIDTWSTNLGVRFAW